MESFYYLVTVEKRLFSDSNYKFVLVAFDDELGNSINSKHISGKEIEDFNKGNNIHYEEFFLITKNNNRQ